MFEALLGTMALTVLLAICFVYTSCVAFRYRLRRRSYHRCHSDDDDDEEEEEMKEYASYVKRRTNAAREERRFMLHHVG